MTTTIQDSQVESNQDALDAEGMRWVVPEVVDFLGKRRATHEAAFFIPHLTPTMRVLDCGCGPGTITVGLAQIVAQGHVVGIDRELAELAQARRYAAQQGIANVEFRVANVYEIPFPDASFDAVLAHAVLQHLSEPAQALQEMQRVLKPGGIIGVREEDRDGDVIYPLPPRLKQAHELLMRLWSQAGGDPYFPKCYRAILREAGFAHIHMTATCEVRSDSASSAMWANALVHFLRQEPTLAERAIELGWADRVTVAELVDALHAWGAHPDAFWSETWCQAVGWKE